MAEEGGVLNLKSITPLGVSSLANVVIDSLRAAIVSGQLAGGQPILPDEIARQSGVSRQPVREALKHLMAEGFITQLPNRRIVVRKYSERDIRENYLLRSLLEGEAASIAATVLSNDSIEELAFINGALKQRIPQSEPTRVLTLNQEFHRIIRSRIQHPTLERLIDLQWLGLTIATPLTIEGRLDRSVSEHDAVIEAIRDHDSHRAKDAMVRHIESAKEEYFSMFSSTEGTVEDS